MFLLGNDTPTSRINLMRDSERVDVLFSVVDNNVKVVIGHLQCGHTDMTICDRMVAEQHVALAKFNETIRQKIQQMYNKDKKRGVHTPMLWLGTILGTTDEMNKKFPMNETVTLEAGAVYKQVPLLEGLRS